MPVFPVTGRSVAAPLVACLAGCTSADRTTSPAPAGEGTPFRAGQLSGTTSGPVGSPVSTNGSGAAVTGLVGRFTSLAFEGESGGGGRAIRDDPNCG